MAHLILKQKAHNFIFIMTGLQSVGYSQTLRVSQSTVSRELHCGRTSKSTYTQEHGQQHADIQKEGFRRWRKFTLEIEPYIRDRIEQEQWFPEQIVRDACCRGVPMVSRERICQYIRENKLQGGTQYQYLRHRLKKRRCPVGAGRGAIPNRVSIHDRPSETAEREQFGHWEIDLKARTNQHSYILTLVERKSRFVMTHKLPAGRSAEQVARMAVDVLIPYKKQIRSVTADNGSELQNRSIFAKD